MNRGGRKMIDEPYKPHPCQICGKFVSKKDYYDQEGDFDVCHIACFEKERLEQEANANNKEV